MPTLPSHNSELIARTLEKKRGPGKPKRGDGRSAEFIPLHYPSAREQLKYRALLAASNVEAAFMRIHAALLRAVFWTGFGFAGVEPPRSSRKLFITTITVLPSCPTTPMVR